MLETLIKFFVMFFVVVEPISLVPLYAALTQGATPEYKRRMARKAVLLAGLILVFFALVGGALLHAMSISLGAFRIFGGLMLFLIALDMVYVRESGARTTTSREEAEVKQREDISVFPLAFPFIAGPGALATVLLVTGDVPRVSLLFAGMMAVVVAVLAITYMLMLLTPGVMRVLGLTGANVVSRLTGVILGALAVQFVIDGVRGSLDRAGG
ncbi:MAG TPA: MarC family protein [Candidatus Polarisedimenticolia bacterium]|nr:MarC family protein [Candidatus Polarisedimenticolia bacterium]